MGVLEDLGLLDDFGALGAFGAEGALGEGLGARGGDGGRDAPPVEAAQALSPPQATMAPENNKAINPVTRYFFTVNLLSVVLLPLTGVGSRPMGHQVGRVVVQPVRPIPNPSMADRAFNPIAGVRASSLRRTYLHNRIRNPAPYSRRNSDSYAAPQDDCILSTDPIPPTSWLPPEAGHSSG